MKNFSLNSHSMNWYFRSYDLIMTSFYLVHFHEKLINIKVGQVISDWLRKRTVVANDVVFAA